MIALPKCKIVGVFGPVRSGKTHLINTWLRSENRYVRFDVTGECLDMPGVEHIFASPKKLHERIESKRWYFRIAYQPGKDLEYDFSFVLNILWTQNKIEKLLVCDEFHEICPISTTNEDVGMLLRYARHDYLGLLAASQRIADVSKLFTSGCDTTVLFFTQEARDLDAIEDRWRCANLVENLRPLIFDDVSKTVKQIPQCVVVRRGFKPEVYDLGGNDAAASTSANQGNDSGESSSRYERDGIRNTSIQEVGNETNISDNDRNDSSTGNSSEPSTV